MKRRSFIINNTVALAGLTFIPAKGLYSSVYTVDFTSNRPKPADRTFTSEAVEKTITIIKKKIADPELAWMFENCFPNTLDTTVDYEVIDGQDDTFIITGDIDAMWLRDSTAQVWPYMPLITQDEKLRKMIRGLVNRQAKCVLKDPYANAFYKDLSKESEWKSDKPAPIPGVHERKWEIDSLCYVVRLAHGYYETCGDTSIFTAEWDRAMRLLVNTLETEQQKEGPSPYYHIRRTSAMIDSPVFGNGRPVKPVGLISSMFRPSDDATLFPFLIPSNIFAVISLKQLAYIYSTVLRDNAFAAKCNALAKEVDLAIQKYAIAEHLHYGKIYAYEVDGFGNKVFMDDANVPSLISLAYLGVHHPDDPVYKNTRDYILSDDHPWFLRGKVAEGMGSPHTGKEMIWPMGIILRALTSTSDDEIRFCLNLLKATHAGTGFMHEGVNKDDPEKFSRSWFAWANTLFGELILKIQNERPHLLS